MRLSTTLLLAFICNLGANAQADLTPTLVFPGSYFPVGTHTFDVMMKNVGTTTVPMNGYKICWQLNNGPVTESLAATPTYGIASNMQIVRITGNFSVSFPSPATYKLKVWTKTLSVTDGNHANDTFVKTVKVLPYVPPKNVLMEVFKHQACCPCIGAAEYEDSVVSSKANYAVVNIYTPPTDDIYNAEGSAVNAVFNLAHPAFFFDRYKFVYANSLDRNIYLMNGSDYLEDMNERDRYFEPVEVSFFSSSYDATARLLKVKLKARFYDTVTGDLRFNLYVTEDSVQAWQGCAVPDPYQYYHKHVLRKMCGGSWGQQGSIPATVLPGQDKFYEFTYTIPATYKLNHLDVIGLVQRYDADSTQRTILNSVKASFNNVLTLGSDGITNRNIELRVFPNPVGDFVFVELPNDTKETEVHVVSADGKIVVARRIMNGAKNKVDVSFLPPGIYSLVVVLDDETCTRTFVKK